MGTNGRQQSTACLPRYGAAIAHDQPAALSLSAISSQYFFCSIPSGSHAFERLAQLVAA
jgi:hypothetical protein